MRDRVPGFSKYSRQRYILDSNTEYKIISKTYRKWFPCRFDQTRNLLKVQQEKFVTSINEFDVLKTYQCFFGWRLSVNESSTGEKSNQAVLGEVCFLLSGELDP